MSYSVYITHGTISKELGNYTYNCSPMFYEVTHKSLNDLNGKKAGMCIPLLQEVVTDMQRRPKHYKKMNPDNGWGNYEGFLQYITEILIACRENPNATLEVC